MAVSALILWFDLILDEEIVVSTSPFGEPERTLALGQGIVYLQPSECRVKRGSTLPCAPPRREDATTSRREGRSNRDAKGS